jgi:hypothetical protein
VRPLPLLLAVLLAAPTLVACKPATQNAQRKIYCTVVADPPTRDNRDHPTKVVGQVRFWCDDPGADSLALTVRLQKQGSSGSWTDLAKTSFTAKTGETIRTDTERYRTRQVTTGCSSGEFRTLVDGTSKARGVTKSYHLSGTTRDPCNTLL